MPDVDFPSLDFPALRDVQLPPLARVRLNHPRGEPIDDIADAARAAIRGSARLTGQDGRKTVAVAVGSRGIAAIAPVAAAVVEQLKALGHEPFIVPAMGSHGGATPEGQTGVLKKLGITEETVGAPIRATMDVVDYGQTVDGVPCKFDRHAGEADAVVVINRVKSHTTFDRPIESGLVKMTAVGLGKAEGAKWVHKLGPRGLSEVLPRLAARALERSPIAFGIALVENAHKDVVALEGVEPEDFFAADERLLKLAKTFIARLPFDTVDALVVERIGKEISGTGMDYAVTGRADIRSVPNPGAPFAAKIAALALSDATGGNGLGIGLADFTTRAAVRQLDLRVMYMNSLTSTLAEKSRIPIVLPTERDAIAAAVTTSWAEEDASCRLCLIHSTLHLNEILVSPGLLAELPDDGTTEQLAPPAPIEFDQSGHLLTTVGTGA